MKSWFSGKSSQPQATRPMYPATRHPLPSEISEPHLRHQRHPMNAGYGYYQSGPYAAPHSHGAPPSSNAYTGWHQQPHSQWTPPQQQVAHHSGAPNGYPYGNPYYGVPPRNYPPYSNQPPPPSTQHSRHHSTYQSRPPYHSQQPEHPQRGYVPYQQNNNPSSTSIGRTSMYQGYSPHVVTPPSQWGAHHSSTYPQSHPYPPSRNQSASSLHSLHPSHNISEGRAHSGPSMTSQTPYPSRERLDSHVQLEQPCKLAPILHAKMREYPSIDWIVWDSYDKAAMIAMPKKREMLKCLVTAFNGILDVCEPITIHAPEGKAPSPLSIAILRWGPIVVKPRRLGDVITIKDVLQGISSWMMTGVDDLDSLEEEFVARLVESYSARRVHSRCYNHFPEDPKKGIVRADALFFDLRWDGLEIDSDFIESKKLYLGLKDIRREKFMIQD